MNSYEALLKEKGISLNIPGNIDIALSREDALRAADLLVSDSIPILGGDVYFVSDRQAEPAYANWYTDSRPGESIADFSRRSHDATIEYINSFSPRDREAVFVLVIGGAP
jgi:hypothetical protein